MSRTDRRSLAIATIARPERVPYADVPCSTSSSRSSRSWRASPGVTSWPPWRPRPISAPTSSSVRSARAARSTTALMPDVVAAVVRAAFSNGATHVNLDVERRARGCRVNGEHPLVRAVRPVVDAVGASLVAPSELEPSDVPLVWEGTDGRRRADAAVARSTRSPDRRRRGRARAARCRRCRARTSSSPSGCSTNAARSSCGAPSRTSPTRCASVASRSTTTSTPFIAESTPPSADPTAPNRPDAIGVRAIPSMAMGQQRARLRRDRVRRRRHAVAQRGRVPDGRGAVRRAARAVHPVGHRSGGGAPRDRTVEPVDVGLRRQGVHAVDGAVRDHGVERRGAGHTSSAGSSTSATTC